MTGEEVVKIIDVIAEKLGTTGEHLISAYVPWVSTAAWTFIALGVVIAICFTLFAIGLWISNERDERGYAFMCLLVGLILGGLFIGSNLPDIVAPEAAAITKVLNMVSR